MSLFPQGFKFWHTIEPDTRRLTLTQAGEMRLGDPLYMLSQQWRMGEFRHAQGSIPIRVDASIAEVPLSAKKDRQGTTEWMDKASRSEEVFAEPAAGMGWRGPESRSISLGLSAQRSLTKVLTRSRELQSEWKAIQTRFSTKGDSNERLMRLRAKNGRNVLDGYALFQAIRGRDVALAESSLWDVLVTWFKSEGGVLSNKTRRQPARRLNDDIVARDGRFRVIKDWNPISPEIDRVRFPNWPGRRNWPLPWPFPVPDIAVEEETALPEADLFDPETLTHTGKVVYETSNNRITLNVEGSHDGILNWTHFNDELTIPDASVRKDWVVPTRLSFPGKPEERLWTLADGAADWTAVSAGPSDLSRMLLGALIAEQSADWTIIPLSVARGSFIHIKELHITTGFGRVMSIDAAGPDHLRLWANLTGQAADTVMTLAEPQPLEGPALEITSLRPDDHANLLWLIERRLPDGDGRGHDVEEHRADFPETNKPVYHLQNDPGGNWYPFAHEPGQPFTPRPFATNTGALKTPVGPTGKSIDSVAQGLVPADGLRVERLWRMGRNHDGRPVRWIARRRGTSGEPASSGLAYDQLVRPKRH